MSQAPEDVQGAQEDRENEPKARTAEAGGQTQATQTLNDRMTHNDKQRERAESFYSMRPVRSTREDVEVRLNGREAATGSEGGLPLRQTDHGSKPGVPADINMLENACQ